MLLSHEKKFVFIHIFKTAGTSVVKVLRPHCRWIDRVVHSRGRTKKAIMLGNRILGLQHNGMRHITGYHKFATAAEIREKMGEERFADYFTFSFVRNPFDWAVSGYFHLKRLEGHPLHAAARDLAFPDFIAYQIAQQPRRQLDCLADENERLMVDFVGRLENLENDLAQICHRVQIPFEGAPHENASPGRKRDFREHYDQRSRRMVEDYFAADLDRFGYAFDGVRSEHSPSVLLRSGEPIYG